MRVVIALGNHHNWPIFQMDVKCFYLNGRLDEEKHMYEPEGYTSEKHPIRVSKLLKSMYGLKQSKRRWNLTLHDFFT